MQDVFIEHMIRQKKDGRDYAKMVGVVLLYFALIYLALVFIQFVAFLFPLIIIGGIYGVYWLISSLNREYEYIVTNGILDIDVIIAKRRRKRVFSGDVRNFEITAAADSQEHKDFQRTNEKDRNVKTIDASSRMNPKDVWFFVGKSSLDDQRYYVLFEPNKRIMENLHRFNPRNVRYNPHLNQLS